MRRSLAFATFVLLLASGSVWAQRGGGRGSAGGHGGMAAHGSFGGHFSGGHGFSGRSSGGRSLGGMRPGLGANGFSRRPSFRQPSHQPSFRQPSFRDNRFRDRRFDRRRNRNFAFRNCFGCGGFGAWPWGYAGYYDPYWWWDSGSSYDEDREREIAEANQMNAQSLEEQRARREEDQDLYARSDAPSRPQAEEHADASPATMLVFRDQHKLEVQNYAIVGQTLWAFAPQRTQKIPLADLDLPTTGKANDERGVDFKVPAASEGQ